jgi:uncharacterized protein YndB with AHSA1/START domain
MPTIHQQVKFKATPQRVFDILTSSKLFADASGAPADIGTEPGSAFSMFGGMITGRTLESTPGKNLIQAWRAGNWAPGLYSIVRFELEGDSQDGKRTLLSLDHSGFPPSAKDELEKGWQAMYWRKIDEQLAK